MVTRIATCSVDGQAFYYTALSWRGKGRLTCDFHRAEIKRAQTKERVRRLRKTKAKQEKRFIVHVKKFGGKGRPDTYCGVEQSNEEVGRALLGNPRAIYRYCKKCRTAFFKDHGIGLPE